MILITLDEAEREFAEFAESVAYYESREPGLGGQLRDEAKRNSISPKIVENSKSWYERFSTIVSSWDQESRPVMAALSAFVFSRFNLLRSAVIWSTSLKTNLFCAYAAL